MWTSKLPSLPDATLDASGAQQVVINIGENDFSKIFLMGHVEFIDKLKNVGRRYTEDDDGNGDGNNCF